MGPLRIWCHLFAVFLCLGIGMGARGADGEAAGTPDEWAEMDRLRAEVAGELQLLAYDLVDELVYSWTQNPVFASEVPVILAGVSAPTGLGAGLTSLIETHFSSLLIRNPQAKMTLVHCPACSGMMVHSGPKGTILARGIDFPETLERIGGSSGSRHAVFLDFEVEGSSLVLRARITALKPELPIVYSKTIASSATSPALLREGTRLKSAAEARQEYLDALRQRGAFSFPIRLVVRSYGRPSNPGRFGATVPPYVWFVGGVEAAFTQARVWSADFSLGLTSVDKSHDGWLVGARVARLVSGAVRSLTQPDLYLFFGGTAISVRGPDTTFFRTDPPPLSEAISDARNGTPRAEFAAWSLGLELRVKNRISVGAFLETIPALDSAASLGAQLDTGLLKFQCLAAEVGFWF